MFYSYETLYFSLLRSFSFFSYYLSNIINVRTEEEKKFLVRWFKISILEKCLVLRRYHRAKKYRNLLANLRELKVTLYQ